MSNKFHSQTTLYESIGRQVAEALTGDTFRGNAVDFYKLMLRKNREMFQVHRMPSHVTVQAHNSYMIEMTYWEKRRPYYLVHSPIIKSLSKMRLDVVTVDMVSLPVEIVSMRLPADDRSFWIDTKNQGRLYCKTILCWLSDIIDLGTLSKSRGDTIADAGTLRTMTMYFDFGEVHEGTPIASWVQLVLHAGMTIQQCVDDVLTRRDEVDEEGHNVEEDITPEMLKRLSAFVIGVSLLSQSAEDSIIVPDVLAKDKEKFAKTGDASIVEKAHRTGKIGWEIGANIEVSPHYRSGTPLAVYWTGVGRTQMTLRPRRSTFVHKKKLEEVPTGFEDETTLSEVKHDSEA